MENTTPEQMFEFCPRHCSETSSVTSRVCLLCYNSIQVLLKGQIFVTLPLLINIIKSTLFSIEYNELTLTETREAAADTRHYC